MDTLEKTDQSKGKDLNKRGGRPVILIDIGELEPIRATPNEKQLMNRMNQVFELYKKERNSSTLDLEITEESFKRLTGRRGFTGSRYSRLVEIIDNGKVEYHVILSPFTNVSEIKHSGNPDREELVLVSKGLNVFEGHDIRFELAPVNSKEVADIEDRSEIYPKDLIRIELIPKETAQLLINH